MLDKILLDIKNKMNFYIEDFKNKVNKIRTNKASIELFEELKINLNNNLIKLKNISNISLKNSNTLLINIFDIKLIKIIEKNIYSYNLGVGINNKKNLIEINFPPLTEEYKNNLIKLLKNESEQNKITIRNIRRNFNEKIKKLLKTKKINKDEKYRIQKNIQNITDYSIMEIEKILINKTLKLKQV